MRAADIRVFAAACVAISIVFLAGCYSDGYDAGSDGTGGIGGSDGMEAEAGAGGEGIAGGAAGEDGTDPVAGEGGADGSDGSEGDAGDSGSESEVETQVIGKSLSSLVAVDSCDDVLRQIKERVAQEAEETLEANLQQALDMLESGNPCIMYDYAMDGGVAGGTGGSGAPPPSANEGGASEYSTTNVQVVGVDEADFVKNDNNYIYVVADNKFQIIDAWPAADTHKIASVDITGTPKKLYVHNDIAVIYSSLGYIDLGDPGPSYDMYMPMPVGGGAEYEQECTYGYNCEFSGDGRELLILTYDISDKTAPRLIRETELSGSYLNSRRIENIVHTVVTFPEIAIPGLVYWPQELQDYYYNCWEVTEFPYTEEEILAMFEALAVQNRETVDAATITDFLPGIKDTRYIEDVTLVEEGLLNSCDNFYLSQAGDGRGFLALVSFDMTELGELGATTIVGKPGAVYASHEALYVAVRHYSSMMNVWYFEEPDVNREATTVHKFALASDSIETVYVGSGVAKGRILNQFSMDELNGYLRIATTSGHVPQPDCHSTLSVLDEAEGELVVVGMVDNIAPTEDIRSVRFNGEVGYMVTFKKTDPLFVFDLSDPENPVTTGELKIPGYSTYMHLMDDTHLLTIGYEEDDQGSFAWFQGIQLQIFDVSDVTNPLLVHKLVTGVRGSSSEAATNHLAFNYFPVRNLLAIPMTVCEESSGGGSYGQMMTFSGLLVYRVTLDEGFTALGGVPHAAPETEYSYSGMCSNWWTDSNSVVQRSIFMSDTNVDPVQDFVYSIAMDLINVSDLNLLETPLTSVELVTTP